jgi:nitrate reductase NapD
VLLPRGIEDGGGRFTRGRSGREKSMMISGVLVVAKPEHQSQVRTALEVLPWAEVHHEDPDGRLVITIEADDTDQAIARLQEVKEVPQVVLAEMVEHYVDDDRER